jgi:hypothetical protein
MGAAMWTLRSDLTGKRAAQDRWRKLIFNQGTRSVVALQVKGRRPDPPTEFTPPGRGQDLELDRRSYAAALWASRPNIVTLPVLAEGLDDLPEVG